MKVFATSAYEHHETLSVMRQLATRDTRGEHRLCTDPEEADIILFVENAQFDDYLYRRLSAHPLVRMFHEKAYMVNEVDKPWCVLPGLYSSMPKRFFQENRQVAFGFFSTPNDYVKYIYKQGDTRERRWLFSFVGALSHRCRKQIIELASRSPSVQDTSDFNVWHCSPDIKSSQGQNYASVMADSKFVLCPRGMGTSSFRLFEAMEAGRAPVIISNQWVEPNFVDWDFVVRIPEHDVLSIPDYLSSIADEANDRGEAARRAWEKTFAPDQVFHTAIDAVGSLAELRKNATTRIYFQNVRKVFIEGELRFMTTARKLRDRISASPDTT